MIWIRNSIRKFLKYYTSNWWRIFFFSFVRWCISVDLYSYKWKKNKGKSEEKQHGNGKEFEIRKFRIAQWNIKSVIGGNNIRSVFFIPFLYNVMVYSIRTSTYTFRMVKNKLIEEAIVICGICILVFFFYKFKVNWISITEMYRLAKCEKQIQVFHKFVWEFLNDYGEV